MKRALVAAPIAVAVLLVGAVIAMRMSRGKFSPPVERKPGFAEVTGMGVSIFAARTGTAGVILFDAGLDPEAHAIDALLAFEKASRADVTHVFITHGHPDHVSGLAAGIGHAKIHAGKADEGWMAGTETSPMMLPRILGMVLPQPVTKMTDPLDGTMSVIDAGGAIVKAYPVPGHTAGHYVYLYDGVLITGDCINVDAPDHLSGPPAPFDSFSDRNKQSVIALGALLKDETIDMVCTAHGGCTSRGKGRDALDAHVRRLAKTPG